MIKRIIAALFLLCLIIAIPLAVLGIKRVDLGEPFLALMKAVNKDLVEYKIAIPDIPTIPATGQMGGGWAILDALIKFFNMIIRIINIFIMVINVVIQMLQALFLIIRHLITFKETLHNYQVPYLPII